MGNMLVHSSVISFDGAVCAAHISLSPIADIFQESNSKRLTQIFSKYPQYDFSFSRSYTILSNESNSYRWTPRVIQVNKLIRFEVSLKSITESPNFCIFLKGLVYNEKSTP